MHARVPDVAARGTVHMPQTSRCAVAGSSTSMTEPWARAIGACDERSHCRRMEPASYIKAQEEARNGNAEHSCQHLFGAELRQLDPANEEVRWAIRQSVSARRVPSSMRGAGAYGFGFPSLSMPPMPSIPSHDCRLFLLFSPLLLVLRFLLLLLLQCLLLLVFHLL